MHEYFIINYEYRNYNNILYKMENKTFQNHIIKISNILSNITLYCTRTECEIGN